MSAGNPEIVIHDGDTICEWFIDKFLEGFCVEIHRDGEASIGIFVTGHATDDEDGFPLIVGYRLDEDWNWDEDSEPISVHWETITKIEVP